MRILLESYGCTLNKGEAEELAAIIQSLGHEMIRPREQPINGTSTDPDPDMAIIFTCGVIHTTELKMLRRIGQLSKYPTHIMVCGCLGAISESEILKVAPEALIFQPASNDEIIEALIRISGISDTSRSSGTSPDDPISSTMRPDKVGMLPIATGCLGDCAYCITRFARGQLKSRSLDEIRERAKILISSGIVELQVTSQDTAIYGMDMGPLPRLPDALDTITSIEGNYMVRVGMMNPGAIFEILEPLTISLGNERMFKFIHIPVQSGNNDVLARMRRRYTTDDFENIVDQLREIHPDIYISTDIITGFPGETDAQFQDSMDLMNKIRPDTINITRFSPRKGTDAVNMPDQVLGWVSKKRSGQMTNLRFEISRHRFSTMMGTNILALATEYRKPGTTFLRTVNYRPVVVEEVLPLGEWHEVKVTGHTDIYMIGETRS